MALIHPIQGSFNSGELSPYLLGRVDIPKYFAGARQILNWIVRPDGSLMRRPGTRFVHEEINSAVKGRLLHFVFSTEQAYTIELGDRRARFYKDEAIILAHTKTFVSGDVDDGNDEVNIDNHFYAHKQGPFQLTTTGTPPGGLSTGVDYYIGNSGLANSPDADYLYFSAIPGGAKIPIDGTGNGTHSIVPGSATTHEIVLPYLESELYALHRTQSADVLYIAHQNHHPRTLTRTGHTSWTLALLDMVDGPYLGLRIPAVGADPVNASLSTPAVVPGVGIVLTSTVALFDAARDINRMIRLEDGDAGTNWRAARIVGVTDSTHATIDYKKNLSTVLLADQITDWHMGAWYTDNWPRTTEFHQQRLGFASTPGQPDRIDLSETADYPDFGLTELDETVIDSNGLTYVVAGAGDVQLVRWMHPLRHMLVGTSNGIWPILAASIDEAVSPTNIHIARANRLGAASIQPVAAASGVIYGSRTRKKLLYARYDIGIDSYLPEDLTLLSDHITGTGIVDMAHALEPFGIVWAVREDGVLPGLTFEQQQEVWGWHRHILGGSFDAGNTVVESVAVIPSPNEDHDQLWLTVKRTINGVTKRYVEFLEEMFGDERDIESAFFVDSGLSLDSPATITGATQANPVVITSAAHPFNNGDSVRVTHVAGMTELNGKSYTVANKAVNTFELSGVDGTGYSEYVSGGEVRLKVSTISGLGHLEGETVAVLGDGAVQPSKVVSGGQISLTSVASEVHVGLGYFSDLETLPLALQDEKGSMQGRKKRPTHAVTRLHRTLGLKVGDSADGLKSMPFRIPADPMDSAPPLYTDLYRQTLSHGHEEDASLYFRKDDPLPATILSVIPDMGVSKR